MRADRVEVSWDNDKKKWLVRIQVGEEFIRRYCNSPKDVNEQKLRADAQKTIADEGYQLDGAPLVLKR
jgi:hypothetical protein